MVSRWIVEIDRALGKAKSEHSGIKIDVSLRIACDGGDMMKAAQFHARKTNKFHRSNSTHVFMAKIGESTVAQCQRR